MASQIGGLGPGGLGFYHKGNLGIQTTNANRQFTIGYMQWKDPKKILQLSSETVDFMWLFWRGSLIFRHNLMLLYAENLKLSQNTQM